nr:ribonuclease H-like domain-containing protein [Tanacetum cinerariifolium]
MQARSSNPSLWSSFATGMGSNVQGINNQELLVCLLGQLGFTTPTNVVQSTGLSIVTLPGASMINPIVYHTHASLVPNFVTGRPGFNAGLVGYFGSSLVYHTTQVQPVHYGPAPLGFTYLTAHPNVYMVSPAHSTTQEFSMTDLGSLNYFLVIAVKHDSSEMFLSQCKYDVEILERAHMVNCNPIRTPVDTESKLGDDGDLVFDPTLYRSLAGSLQYLNFTRIDISYAVQQVCLYKHDPREPHLSALKRIFRYVRGTLDYGLQLFSFSTTDLVAYSDVNWAGCPTTRRPTSGYYVFLGNNLLSWSSKRQLTLSRSSVEADYRVVANHQQTKHIEIDIHFVRDLVAAGQVRVFHVSSRYQYADIFTKGLSSSLFEKFRTSLSVQCPLAPTASEC